MQSIHRVFGENVRARRRLKDWSIETLAERACLDAELVATIEQGKADSALDVIQTLARALDVDPAELTTIPGRTPKTRS